MARLHISEEDLANLPPEIIQEFLDNAQAYNQQQVVQVKERNYDPAASYLANLSHGPILLTAPHSVTVNRGGKAVDGGKVRLHNREHWASTIALQLASAIWEMKGPASYAVWHNDQSKIDINDRLDPNYLIPAQFEHSAFHCSLHKWALNNENKPLFHIDIHGKKDRKGNAEVDFGIEPIQYYLPNSEQEMMVAPLVQMFAQKMDKVFSKVQMNGFKVWFNPDCELHGMWGGDESRPQYQKYTMVMQGCQMGIPSIQLEIPRTLRRMIAMSPEKLIKPMAKAILEIYNEVIVPAWAMKEMPIGPLNVQLADRVKEIVHKAAELKQLASKFQEWDAKATKNLI